MNQHNLTLVQLEKMKLIDKWAREQGFKPVGVITIREHGKDNK